MYIISQVRVRRTSHIRNYLRLHSAYVTRPHELTFSGHVGNQFWIKPRVGTKIESALIQVRRKPF